MIKFAKVITLIWCTSLFISCGGGSSTPDSVANVAPDADTGVDQIVEQSTLVTLDGSSSSDSDGNIVRFSWLQIDGSPTVSIMNPTQAVVTFTAPDVTANTPLTFELTVTDDDGATGVSSVVVTILASSGSPSPYPLLTDVRSYSFGHSLMNHQFGEATDLTNILIWMHELSQQANYTFAMSGQFGFGQQHVESLPPIGQWGIAGVTPANAGEVLDHQTWVESNFNIVMYTPANFRQHYPADQAGDFEDITTETTATLFNYAETADPGNARYIIYENWADMGPYTNANFSSTFPTPLELNNYWSYVQGSFHDWWIDYHDVMLEQNPELDIRMIPVGYILGTLLQGTLSDIEPANLYEDNAPHGRATLYFLAGLINYMGTYGIEAPANYVVSDNIDSRVRDSYSQIVSEIWIELQNFNDTQGNSRVFPN